MTACCVVAVSLALSACSTPFGKHPVLDAPVGPSPFDNRDPAPQEQAASDEVGPEGGTVALDTLTVSVPAGAVAAGQTITIHAMERIGNHGAEVFGQPLGVDHSQPLAQPLVVTWPTEGFTEQQLRSLVLAKWNPDIEAWEVSDTPLTIEDGKIAASIQSFSFWDVIANIGQEAGEWTGSRTDPPQCTGNELPTWVKQVVDTDEDSKAAAILTCFEPDKDERVTVRIANNRTFSQQIVMTEGDQKWAWTWPGEESYGVSDAIYNAAHSVFDDDTTYFIPPLQTVAVGVDRPATPKEVVIQSTAHVSPITMFVDLTSFAFNQLPVGLGENPLVDAFIQTGYDCGGKALLEREPGSEAKDDLQAVVDTITGCFGGISDASSPIGQQFEKLARQAIDEAGSSLKGDTIAKSYRVLDEASKAMKLLTIGEVAFYVSDQLADALVGPLSWSIRGRGQPQTLGDWKPTCTSIDKDSNRLYKNLALQDAFADNSKELWEFSDWAPSAAVAVSPLKSCSGSYLQDLADNLPSTWGDPTAAEVVANAIRDLSEPRDTPTTQATPTQAPPQTQAPDTGNHAIGSSFDDSCVVAWPTAPQRSTQSIVMRMTCGHVPSGQFLFTDVTYDDPNLDVTPSTGYMRVRGTIVDIAQSEYGFSVLLVYADRIELK